MGLPHRDGTARPSAPRPTPDRHHPGVLEVERTLERLIREAARRRIGFGDEDVRRAVEAAMVMVRGRRRGA